MSARSDHWGAIIDMTHAMLSCAQRQEWDDVIHKEQERRRALEAFFAQQVTVDEAEAVASGIRELMALDNEILAMGRTARDEVARQAGLLQRGRRAEAAYDGNR